MAMQQGAEEKWIKSSYSAGNGACVEVKSPFVQIISVRDSKVTAGPRLDFAPGSWTAFVTDVSRGTFDLG